MSIKKHITSAVAVLAIGFSLFAVSTNCLAAPSYIQLAGNDSMAVSGKMVNTAQPANLSMQDARLGTALSWDKQSPNIITVHEDGPYFLMTVAQVGAKEGVQYQGADVRIWNTLNGKVIPDSGSWVYASEKARAKTIVSQLLLNLKKGDQIGFLYSSSGENGGLV